jgi:hypothetical protein
MPNPKSQSYRRQHADKFTKLRDGVWGGFRPGIMNGPEPTNKRRRDKSKHTPYKG